MLLEPLKQVMEEMVLLLTLLGVLQQALVITKGEHTGLLVAAAAQGHLLVPAVMGDTAAVAPILPEQLAHFLVLLILVEARLHPLEGLIPLVVLEL
jgi:hypothetical protein